MLNNKVKKQLKMAKEIINEGENYTYSNVALLDLRNVLTTVSAAKSVKGFYNVATLILPADVDDEVKAELSAIKRTNIASEFSLNRSDKLSMYNGHNHIIDLSKTDCDTLQINGSAYIMNSSADKRYIKLAVNGFCYINNNIEYDIIQCNGGIHAGNFRHVIFSQGKKELTNSFFDNLKADTLVVINDGTKKIAKDVDVALLKGKNITFSVFSDNYKRTIDNIKSTSEVKDYMLTHTLDNEN